MKIYFTAAVSLKPRFGTYYQQIVDHLLSVGHEVIHEHITQVSQADIEEIITRSDKKERIGYYQQVNKWINEADLVVAELSFPSTLNVGHEVTLALKKNKYVLGLFLNDNISHFFYGIDSDKFLYESYNERTLKSILDFAVTSAQNAGDVRFNFFLSPQLNSYLAEASAVVGLSKSTFLRQLLIEHQNRSKS